MHAAAKARREAEVAAWKNLGQAVQVPVLCVGV
jgi:hypothetical protein